MMESDCRWIGTRDKVRRWDCGWSPTSRSKFVARSLSIRTAAPSLLLPFRRRTTACRRVSGAQQVTACPVPRRCHDLCQRSAEAFNSQEEAMPPPPRVLIVEDEIIVARDLEQHLTTLGYG